MPDIKESYEVKKLLESDRAGLEALFCYLSAVLTSVESPPLLCPSSIKLGSQRQCQRMVEKERY